NGFSFEAFNAHDMAYTVRYALSCIKEPQTRRRLMENAMTTDFSWKKSAKEYKELYRSLLGV
ncbi:MAG: starch synthase, partial [Firmicutes bacterium]|nr:starch synthase [Bacillota bacterium]